MYLGNERTGSGVSGNSHCHGYLIFVRSLSHSFLCHTSSHCKSIGQRGRHREMGMRYKEKRNRQLTDKRDREAFTPSCSRCYDSLVCQGEDKRDGQRDGSIPLFSLSHSHGHGGRVNQNATDVSGKGREVTLSPLHAVASPRCTPSLLSISRL